MTATGRGDVKIQTKDNNCFTLINVLYLPSLASNLISLCNATKNPNIRINFTRGECQIWFKENKIATASSSNSLLVLETIVASALVTQSIDPLTWHKRLGHMNEKYMKNPTIKSVIGPIDSFTCEACLKNKSTRITSLTPPVRASRPLEKIHSVRV